MTFASPDRAPYPPLASRKRRFAGWLLEDLLFLVTLGVGWLIWLYFAAQTSQTPAKRLLGMYVFTQEGEPASARRVWLRDVGLEIVVIRLIGQFTLGIVLLVDAAWILWDRDNQTLHDKIAETVVLYAPDGIAHLRRAQPTAWQPGTDPRPPSTRDTPSARSGRVDAYTEGDLSRRLDDLETLRREGLITERQYEERRRRLLDED